MEKIDHNGLANGKTMGHSVRRGSFFTSSNMSHEFSQRRFQVFIWLLSSASSLAMALTYQPMLTTILGDSGLAVRCPVLTTILGDGSFTGMFPALITLAGLFANSSEVTGTEVTDEDFWNDIHTWTANIFSRRVLADKVCRALREICIPLLFRKVRIYRAEYRAIQPLKAMLLNDRIQRSMITYGVRARTSTLSHRAVARRRS
ncbi:hypothetical protein K4K58_007511 [Colletotrichum sp. SAR11_239]|nr:hypothetical protein K4K58_007511 [Colletotrichum sp. SAR11_239]